MSRRVLRSVVAAVLLLLVAGGTLVFVRWHEQFEETTIPETPLPTVNAHDYYSNAGRAIQDWMQVHFAYEAMRNREPLEPRQIRELLAQSEPAKGILETGLAYPYVMPPFRATPLPLGERALPEILPLLELLALTVENEGDRQNLSRAWQAALRCLHITTDLPWYASASHLQMALDHERFLRFRLWKWSDTLPPREGRTVVRELEDLEAHRAAFAESMQWEKWATLRYLHGQFRRKSVSSVASEIGVLTFANQWAIWRTRKSEILARYAAEMDSRINWAKNPLAGEMPKLATPLDPLTKALLPDAEALWREVRFIRAQAALLIAEVAVYVSQKETGTLPDSLELLVQQGILRSLPQDPYSDKPLVYRRLPANRFALYSIGPDNRDDGGTFPVEISTREPVTDVPGDILAGGPLGRR
ncbi:MAG: hypothetical protein OHK0029_09220 [Armatimonadaceae bacterium]